MQVPELHADLLNWVLNFCAIVLGLCVVCTIYRLLRGRSLPDRVISLDLIGYFTVGIISVYTIANDRFEILSVAIVMALVLFLGTAAFASFLERRARP